MIILDVRCLEEKASAHQYLKQALALPEYYGCNLDGSQHTGYFVAATDPSQTGSAVYFGPVCCHCFPRP